MAKAKHLDARVLDFKGLSRVKKSHRSEARDDEGAEANHEDLSCDDIKNLTFSFEKMVSLWRL